MIVALITITCQLLSPSHFCRFIFIAFIPTVILSLVRYLCVCVCVCSRERRGGREIADQQKAGKQGRDDNVKQFSTQLHPVHIFNVEIYV